MPSDSTDRSQLILTVHRQTVPSVRWAAAILAGLLLLAVYWLTAYRTITWWSSAGLALAASDLGVVAPPGAVIPTILGWVVMHLAPGVSDIFALNLFAGVLAALTVAGVLLTGYRLEWVTGRLSGASSKGLTQGLVLISAGAAALASGLGEPLWEYALHYNEYIVTPLFTVLILWSMFRWWEAAPVTGGMGWLFLSMLLFGLDVSVHRTNALLLPALVIWVLLGHPRTVLSLKAWLAGAGGFAVGLAFHLVLIPMAAADPFLNIWEPDTLERWWGYVSLKMMGGGFLFDVYPRKADFWNVQVMDWLRAFTRTFATPGGPLGVLGSIPLLLGMWGAVVMFRRSWRLGLGLVVLFLAASAGAIVYFNVPENFFRTLYRHYFPSLVIFGILAVIGAAALMRAMRELAGTPGKLAPIAVTILVLLAPVNSLLRNYERLDASEDHFAHDYASNLLLPLAPDAILMTQGDNDTFPLWYLQRVEGVRPDVTVINIPLTNTGWFVGQRMQWDPDLPLDFTQEELAGFSVIPWSDSTVAIAVGGEASDFALPDTLTLMDTVQIEVKPTIADQYLLGQDRVMLRLLQDNEWRRPVYIVSALGQGTLPWVRPYLRPEGLVSRVVPVMDPPLDTAILAGRLFEEYTYRGFEREPDSVEQATLGYIHQVAAVHARLMSARFEAGDTTAARQVCGQMFERLQLDEWLPEATFLEPLKTRCGELKSVGAEPDGGQ